MKKFAALLLAVAMLLSLSAVSFADTFLDNSVYAEAGYEGDCYNGVAVVLTLNEDGTFTLIDNTSIIQAQYKVVTNWFTVVTGTYEILSEEEGVLTVQITVVDAYYVMNGSVTTLAEDAEIAENYAGLQYECDTDTYALTALN